MIYIFELSEECSGGAEDCKLLLHPASFFMFVFHVKNVSLLQGGAGRGGARRALVRTVIPISWSIHHGSSSSPHHCWGLTEPSSAVCGEPVVGRFTVRTPHHHHHHSTTTDASPHCGGRARPRPLLHIVLLLLGWGRRLEAGPGHHVNISAPAAPPPAPAPGLRPRPHLPRPRPLHGGAGRGGEQRQSSRDSAPRNTQLPHTAANTGAATAGQLAAEPRTGREGNFICFLFRDCFGPASLSRDSLAW